MGLHFIIHWSCTKACAFNYTPWIEFYTLVLRVFLIMHFIRYYNNNYYLLALIHNYTYDLRKGQYEIIQVIYIRIWMNRCRHFSVKYLNIFNTSKQDRIRRPWLRIKMLILRVEKRAQLAKCLPHQHKNVRLNS